jgi:hypothetical protein
MKTQTPEQLPPLITRSVFIAFSGLSEETFDVLCEVGAITRWQPPGWTRKALYYRAELLEIIRPKPQTTTNGH